MSRSTPQMRDLSQRLMALETKGKKTSLPKAAAAFHVCEKLRPHLATLMGGAGFRALLARALTVASVEVAWLSTVQVKADGSLEGLDGHDAQADPEAMTEGCIVLVAQLLGLLVAFIGEDLTLRMLREVWLKLPLNDLDLSKGDRK